MTRVARLAVDHVGLVVADLAASIAAFRTVGFQVSDPVALMTVDSDGRTTPLGQDSAHIILENAYIEISAPRPGTGNHLEPYLAFGPGLRILCLASDDLVADHIALSDLAASSVVASTRVVRLRGGDRNARFRWCSIRADFWPGILVAVVEHLDRDIVFTRELREHPNGARRLTKVTVAPGAPTLARLAAALHVEDTALAPALEVGLPASLQRLPRLDISAGQLVSVIIGNCCIETHTRH